MSSMYGVDYAMLFLSYKDDDANRIGICMTFKFFTLHITICL